MRLKLRGSFNISGSMSGTRRDDTDAADYVEINFIDEESHIEVFELCIEKRAFIDAVFGRGYLNANLEVSQHPALGLKREHKSEQVFIPTDYSKKSGSTVRKAIAEYEVDGWIGDDEDGRNGHRMGQRHKVGKKEGHYYSVTFRRWVKPDGTPFIMGDEG